MQQSSVSISLSFENQGINPVGDDAQVNEYVHKQSRTCNQHDKGVVNPLTVTRKSEISQIQINGKVNIFGIFGCIDWKVKIAK